MRLRLIAILTAVVVGVGLGFGVNWLWLDGGGHAAKIREGASFGEVPIGGPFRLIDHNGTPRGPDDFKGQLLLVNFGYTFCPDVCPIGLQTMTAALDQLGGQAERVQPLFITIDPERDTPEVLKSYVEHFTPRLIGLTGSAEDIAKAARAYRVYYKVAGDAKSDPNYLVDHSVLTYLMGPDGKFLTHFTHQTPPDKMAATIRRYL